jgi:hypothetical protein
LHHSKEGWPSDQELIARTGWFSFHSPSENHLYLAMLSLKPTPEMSKALEADTREGLNKKFP